MNREILVGDVIEKLKDIPDESIDVMITSPPYWGLRDYGVDKQWGSEKSFRDYLDKLDKLMVEMKRVLKKTGSCWVNLGDTYSTVSGGMRDISKGNTKQYGKIQYLDKGTGDREVYGVDQSKMYEGLQTKSRVGIPERFYINCIDNEWIARNHIPWHKNNPMPSSVKDRFSNKWESIFFFVKNPKYYFNLDAVRERTITREKRKTRIQYDGKSVDTSAFMPPNPKGKNPGDYFDDTVSDRKHSYVDGQPPQSINVEGYRYSHPKGKNPGDVFEGFGKYEDKETETKHRQGMNRERGEGMVEKRDLPSQKEFVDKLRANFSVDDIVECGLERSTVEHWFRYDESGFSYPDAEDWHKVGTDLFPELLEVYYVSDEIKHGLQGKNPGDIFNINTHPYPEAHFATFPEALPIKILKCACPTHVCKKCGKPRENEVECCNVGWESGIVLDPFFGSGTTGVAAEKLGLRWIGIELNDEYVKIARKRLDIFRNKKLEDWFTDG